MLVLITETSRLWAFAEVQNPPSYMWQYTSRHQATTAIATAPAAVAANAYIPARRTMQLAERNAVVVA